MSRKWIEIGSRDDELVKGSTVKIKRINSIVFTIEDLSFMSKPTSLTIDVIHAVLEFAISLFKLLLLTAFDYDFFQGKVRRE